MAFNLDDGFVELFQNESHRLKSAGKTGTDGGLIRIKGDVTRHDQVDLVTITDDANTGTFQLLAQLFDLFVAQRVGGSDFCRRFTALGGGNGSEGANDLGQGGQAAVAGQGVALGWKRTVGDMIEDGKLCPVSDRQIDRPNEISVFRGTRRSNYTAVDCLTSWLKAQLT